VSWSASTRTFGEPYGSQRGGVELTLLGPPDAVVTVKTANGSLTSTIREIERGVVQGTVDRQGRLLV
jgi:hypothetical protein